MGESLYVERETYPSVIPGEEIMVFSRDKGSEAALAKFFVVALNSATTFEVRSGQGLQTDTFDVTAGPGSMTKGQRARVDLPVTAAADHNVYVIRCLTGRLAATIVSPHRVQLQFRNRAGITV